MASANIARPVRFGITLHPAVAMESLINRRLDALPAARRQEWLRALLIRGFCEECADIRRLQADDESVERYVPATRSVPSPATTTKQREVTEPRVDPPPQPRAPSAATPLAALKAVLG